MSQTTPRLAAAFAIALAVPLGLANGARAETGLCNSFTLTLNGLLGRTGNVVSSPYSLATALAMLHPGAKGRTARDLEKALGFAGAKVKGPNALEAAFQAERASLASAPNDSVFEEANALWPDQKFTMRPAYLEAVATYFGAKPEPLDFQNSAGAAAARINSWVGEKTHKKISTLVTEGDVKQASLVLTNAVYFKGDWVEPFKEELTQDEPFFREDGTSQPEPLMREQLRLAFLDAKDAQVVALPYLGPFDLVIALPKSKNGGSLAALDLKAALAAFDRGAHNHLVNMVLPRFRVESSNDLTDTLKALGLGDLLKTPDLSGLTAEKGLFVSRVLQKAMINTDEHGTEAAAATAMAMAMAAFMPNPETPVDVRVDHPFAFALRHRSSGTILFIGRYAGKEQRP